MRSRPGVPVAFVAALALLAASLLGATSAAAAGFVNGSFETGTLEGWNVAVSGAAGWRVAEAPEGQPFGPPYEGRFAALSEQGPGGGTAILYQDVALEPGTTDTLRLTFGYSSRTRLVIPQPNSLSTAAPIRNQQVRVDVIKPTAPIESLAPEDILATVFASSEAENAVEGGQPFLEARRFTVDLSAFAGQTVRLRFAVAANAANEKPLVAEVDAVSLTSAPLPAAVPPPPPASPAPLPNKARRGKLTLNRNNGTAELAVAVPAAGTLTAMDARTKIAIASMAATTAKGRRRPALIKAATVRPTTAATVEVPIVPTAAGRRVLEEKGVLKFRARLTFTPTGGTAATQVYTSKLVRTLRY